MTERCWEELYRAGKAIDEGCPLHEIVDVVAHDFDLPRSPEAEAVSVFLGALAVALKPDLLDLELLAAKAAE